MDSCKFGRSPLPRFANSPAPLAAERGEVLVNLFVGVLTKRMKLRDLQIQLINANYVGTADTPN